MIETWNKYIQGDLQSFSKKINAFNFQVNRTARAIEEGAIIAREWSVLLFNSGIMDFVSGEEELVEKMENLASLLVENTKVDDALIGKYTQLPLSKIDAYGYLLSVSDRHYSLKNSDLKFSVCIYSKLLDHLFKLLKGDLDLKLRQATKLNEVRLWICEQLQLIQNSIEPAYINVMKRENMAKNLYFQKNIEGY